MTDAAGRRVRLFPDVLGILDWCDQRQIPMALASRTEQPGWARELLSLLGIRERFVQSEIYPTTKLVHFESLREGLGIDYTKMLFFDDEARNIREVGTTGVRCIFVRDGMTRRILEEAIESGQ